MKISMDGKGRYADNIFVEWLWRTVKYEEVYLKAYVNALVLQRRFKEGCSGTYEGWLGAWHGSAWLVRCTLASP